MPHCKSRMMSSDLDIYEWAEDKAPTPYSVKAVDTEKVPPRDNELPPHTDQTHAPCATEQLCTRQQAARSLPPLQDDSLEPCRQSPAFKGRIFLMLGNTTEQQALELQQQEATILHSPNSPRNSAFSSSTVVICGQQATADPLYWRAQALGCQMLDADALSAVLQRPSTLLNFLTGMPGNPPTPVPPRGSPDDGCSAPATDVCGHDLAQQPQQQECGTHNTLAPMVSSRHPSKPFPQHHNQDSTGSGVTSQQQQRTQRRPLVPGAGKQQADNVEHKPLSGQVFAILGASKIISYRDKLFTVQHWQQQLEQLGATVVSPQLVTTQVLHSNRTPSVAGAVAGQASCGKSNSAGGSSVIVVVTDSSTTAYEPYQAAQRLGCRILDVEGMCNLLSDPSHLQKLVQPMPAVDGPVHAAEPAAVAGATCSQKLLGDGVAAQQVATQQKYRLKSPGLQQEQPRQAHPHTQVFPALQGRTFMFVGDFKKRNSIIGKLKHLAAQFVWTPGQASLGPNVIVIAGGSAASRPQYAAAYQLGCKMLRRKWLKTVIGDPEQLDALLEGMAPPSMAAVGAPAQAQQHHEEQQDARLQKGPQTAVNPAARGPALSDDSKQQKQDGQVATKAKRHRRRGKKPAAQHPKQQPAATGAERAEYIATHTGSAANAAVMEGNASSDSEVSEGVEWAHKYATMYCSQDSGIAV